MGQQELLVDIISVPLRTRPPAEIFDGLIVKRSDLTRGHLARRSLTSRVAGSRGMEGQSCCRLVYVLRRWPGQVLYSHTGGRYCIWLHKARQVPWSEELNWVVPMLQYE